MRGGSGLRRAGTSEVCESKTGGYLMILEMGVNAPYTRTRGGAREIAGRGSGNDGQHSIVFKCGILYDFVDRLTAPA